MIADAMLPVPINPNFILHTFLFLICFCIRSVELYTFFSVFTILFDFPKLADSIGRKLKISSWRKANATDFRPVGKAGAFKLLGEEASHKYTKPALYRLGVVIVLKGEGCEAQDLLGRIATANKVIKEEIVKLVRADDSLGTLGNLTVLRRRSSITSCFCWYLAVCRLVIMYHITPALRAAIYSTKKQLQH